MESSGGGVWSIPWGGGLCGNRTGATHPSEFPKNQKAENHPFPNMVKNPISVNHQIYNVSKNTVFKQQKESIDFTRRTA